MGMISTQVSELELEDFQGKVTQNIVLSNVSWQTYKALLTDMGDHRAARLTYNRGILQIKMPSKLHEIIPRSLQKVWSTRWLDDERGKITGLRRGRGMVYRP